MILYMFCVFVETSSFSFWLLFTWTSFLLDDSDWKFINFIFLKELVLCVIDLLNFWLKLYDFFSLYYFWILVILFSYFGCNFRLFQIFLISWAMLVWLKTFLLELLLRFPIDFWIAIFSFLFVLRYLFNFFSDPLTVTHCFASMCFCSFFFCSSVLVS